MSFIGFEKSSEWANRHDVRPAGVLPSLQLYTDVFALPKLDALYHADGTRLEASKRVTVPVDIPAADAAAKHVEKSFGRHCPPIVEIPNRFETWEETALYGGLSWPHYGHFLTDGMSRLWALEHADPMLPILYLDRAHEDFGFPAFAATVVDALGIRDRLFKVTAPTLFKRILVPEAAIQHSFRIYHAHASPHEKVAAAILSRRKSRFTGAPVYLSRSRLNDRLRRAPMEIELEEKLSRRGFKIVFPETMTFEDQIDIVNNSPLIAGMIGSALHTVLFGRRGKDLRIVALTWEKVNGRYLMIDEVKGCNSIYVRCSEIRSIDERGRVQDIDLDVELGYQQVAGALER